MKVRWILSKVWNIVYDDTWREIMREVAVEKRIPLADVERMNTAWWKYVGEMMMRPELPVIRLTYLFNIYPSRKKLFGYCEKMGTIIDRIVNGATVNGEKKVGDVEAMSKHLWVLQNTYFRLEAERAKRKRVERVRTDKDRANFEKYKSEKRRLLSVTMAEARKLKKQINDRTQ